MVHMMAHGQGSIKKRLPLPLGYLFDGGGEFNRQFLVLGIYRSEEGPVASIKKPRGPSVDRVQEI
jgi:hypothetical protein